jgi:hypothetical protein
MDLIRRLETEAAAAGGAVHLTLGNHELMNMVGDLRYVAPGEYAAFASEESSADRSQAFRAYAALRPGLETAAVQAAFDESFPVGYFAHRRAFAADGVYGAWLLEKPALVVIGDTAFVHGGLPGHVAKRGAAAINEETHTVLREYLVEHRRLVEAGVLSADVAFYDQPDAIDSFLADQPDCCESLGGTADRVKELNGSRIFDSRGVLWYRGTAGCPAAIEDSRLSAALARIGAKRVVVGHTPDPKGVRSRLDDKVIRIDTGMLTQVYGGIGAALVIEAGRLSVVYQDGRRTAIVAEVGGIPTALGLTRSDIESELRTAPLTTTQEQSGDGVMRLSLTLGGYELGVDFIPGGRDADEFLPDVAAYRLDQILGIDMVPITVARTVDGKRGSLRLMPRRLVSEADRLAAGGSGYCPLRDQFQAMYVFDALLDFPRPTEALRYAPGGWSLTLVGHDGAFGTGRSVPKHLAPVLADLDANWRERLESLQKDELESHLGDVLNKRRIAALLKRRDQMTR